MKELHWVQQLADLSKAYGSQTTNFVDFICDTCERLAQEIEFLTISRDGWKADAEREVRNNAESRQWKEVATWLTVALQKRREHQDKIANTAHRLLERLGRSDVDAMDLWSLSTVNPEPLTETDIKRTHEIAALAEEPKP